MDGLFSIIFYIIMGIVWVISTAKKQEELKKQTPNLAKRTPLKPTMTIIPQVIARFDPEPEEEGDFFTESSNDPLAKFALADYNQQLDIIKKQLQIKQKPQIIADSIDEPLIIDAAEEMPEPEDTLPSITPIIDDLKQKQPYHLKSSLKEGIIWSIVLGAPRSKQAFNWLQIPLNR